MAKKIFFSILIGLISLAIYRFSGNKIPYLDFQAESYFSETIAEAALAYATVRGVNAVVSVLKESQIELSPAGIGINIAAGQVLDPIDDMTERLSSVVVTAFVSLGLQKLMMEIGELVPLKCAAFILPFSIIAIWLPSGKHTLLLIVFRICVLLLMLRLILPFSSLVNDTLYKNLFKDGIISAQQQLSVISKHYNHLTDLDIAQPDGFLTNLAKGPKQKLQQTKELFNQISSNVESIITALLDLTIFYISLFILQVIIIPVGMLWLMVLFVNTMFRTGIILEILNIRRTVVNNTPKKEHSKKK